jgi:hypothetical protein
MTKTFRNCGVALALALVVAAPVYAQSGGSRSQSDHAPGMDMQAMTGQCAQMRRQMQAGSRMSPDMQAMMRQCDQMDAQMNSTSGNPSGARPRTR